MNDAISCRECIQAVIREGRNPGGKIKTTGYRSTRHASGTESGMTKELDPRRSLSRVCGAGMTNEDCGIILEMSFRVLRWRRCHAVTEVEIVGTVPRAVRNGAFGKRALLQ